MKSLRRLGAAALSAALFALAPAAARAQDPGGGAQFGQQRLLLHVESVGVDPITVRPLIRSSLPRDVLLVDSSDFVRVMESKGQVGSMGKAFATASERLALFERMRAAAVELHADGAILALMIDTPKRRAVRLVVQFATDDDVSLDQLVVLDAAKAGTDHDKIEPVLKPVLERFRPPPTPPPPPQKSEVPAAAAAVLEAPSGNETKKPNFPWTLSVGLNAHLDAYFVAGSGVSEFQRSDGSGLTGGAEVRRVRPRISGNFAEKFFYLFHLDFGGSNVGGAGQNFVFRGGASHAWVAYKHSEALNVQFGQFPQPFTFENLRPNMMLDFMDPSRTLLVAAPNALDTGLMVFGQPGRFGYGVGIFNGEGRNRVPLDSRGEVTERLTVAFNQTGTTRARIGVSGRQGMVDPTRAFGEVSPAAFTTTRGFNYWTPSYNVIDGVAPGLQATPLPVSVVPSGAQQAYAADVEFEIGDFSVQAEGAYIHNNTREVDRSRPDVENTLRTGSMSGPLYYVTLGYWLFGSTRPLRDLRWEQAIFRLGAPRDEEPFQPSLLLLARWEELFLSYDSVSRSPFGIERGLIDSTTTRLRTDILTLNATTWLSTRFSVLTEWSTYMFPGNDQSPDPRSIDNQAYAPGAIPPGERGTRPPVNLPFLPVSNPTYFEPADREARSYHEFSIRARLQF